MELIRILLFLVVVLTSCKKTTEETTEDITEENYAAPYFSLKSGFYDKKLISLEIFSPDPKAEIYYTTDGSIPTENSTKYEGAITLVNKSDSNNVLSAINNVSPSKFVPSVKVKKGHVIRAIAKLPDGKFTDIANGTFFVGINKKETYGDLPVFSMITDPNNLFDEEKGIYVLGKTYDEWCKGNSMCKFAPSYTVKGNYSLKGKEAERPAYIEYFPKGSNVTAFAENLGIRIMGAATRTYVQKSFHLTFREEYGKKKLKYEVIPGNMRSDGKGPVKKYKSFNIRNGGNDCEYTKIRDKTIQDLIYQRESIETQQQDFAILFIDGEYWGVYIVIENYSDNHIENNYDIDNKNVIIIKKGNVEAGEEDDIKLFDEFNNYVTTTDLTIPSNYDKLKEIIDVESFVWYFAVNTYIENKDGIFQNNNWAFWRVREPQDSVKHADGKWRAMIYDVEYSTGLYGDKKYNSTAMSNVVENKPHGFGNVLFNSLMSNHNFKNLFINALSDLVNIDFESERVNNIVQNYSSIVKPLMKDQIERFGPSYAVNDPDNYFSKQISELNNWLSGRHKYFLNNIAKTFKFENPIKVTIESNDYSKGSFVVNNGWKVFNEKYVGDYFKENILYITAKSIKTGSTFIRWKLQNCKYANKKYQSIINVKTSYKETIGIYPSSGCRVMAFFS